jgi:adenylylsulfate reductase, subunit A
MKHAPPVTQHRTDLLIIGGGTAGCMAAILARRLAPDLSVTILEKAHINRSGCLAMGLNAVNAYLANSTPEEYAAYVARDNSDVVRADLVLSIGRRLNRMTGLLGEIGVPLPRDADGRFIARSPRSIVMYGEHIKPLLAAAARSHGAVIFNRTPACRLIMDARRARVCGAVAFSLRTGEILDMRAGAVLICTGGASGIYRPSNPGLARTKTWYCPYNAGTGLAMGFRAGAEMTSFEMRFVALRTKDVIAPTGTLVLGTRMPQCNARGVPYLTNIQAMLSRTLTTCERLHFTIIEHKKGAGPCYVDISGLSAEQYGELVKSYLNMSPSIALHLLEDPRNPLTRVEVCGSEPYVNGGHGMAGFWIDENRQTTVPGLYAAGDVAGGAPKKYITGCFAEAEIAVEHILASGACRMAPAADPELLSAAVAETVGPLHESSGLRYTDVEDRLQKIMEEYAGGSTQNYETSRDKLVLARSYLSALEGRARELCAGSRYDLMRTHDARDRILLARILVEHLLARRETRWPCYQTRLDYPLRNDLEFRLFIESRQSGDGIQMFSRDCETPFAENILEAV